MGTENCNARGREARKYKKVYITLVASYAALLFLLLGALTGLFVLAANSITEQIRQVNGEVAKKAVDMIDSETDAIFTRAGVILTDERVKRLKNCDAYEPDETALLMQLEKIIKQELVRETLVKEIYVYFDRTGCVMNTQGFYQGYSFDYKLRATMGISYEEWQDILSFDGAKG